MISQKSEKERDSIRLNNENFKKSNTKDDEQLLQGSEANNNFDDPIKLIESNCKETAPCNELNPDNLQAKESEILQNINNLNENDYETNENKKELDQEPNQNFDEIKSQNVALERENDYNSELKNSLEHQVLEVNKNYEGVDEDINESPQKDEEILDDKMQKMEDLANNHDAKYHHELQSDIKLTDKNNESNFQDQDKSRQDQINDAENDIQFKEQIKNEFLVNEVENLESKNFENIEENKNESNEDKENNNEKNDVKGNNNQIDFYENENIQTSQENQKEMLESGNHIEKQDNLRKSKESIKEYKEITNERISQNEFFADISPKFIADTHKECYEKIPEIEKKNDNIDILSKSNGEFRIEQDLQSINYLKNSLNSVNKTNFEENAMQDAQNNAKNGLNVDDIEKNNIDGCTQEMKNPGEIDSEKNKKQNFDEEYENEEKKNLFENYENNFELNNKIDENTQGQLETNKKVKQKQMNFFNLS